ncbi:hypothetical protein PR048_018355 [Dryococelus australis]|uniref:Uncharacterized protein n=1 Tax=Dryococelus australis TaxID=614101 RepID=A0ABQ9HC74_9NEOP|nr:hypothetical protein PR048_018355 [Dryococelus australis]
MSKAKIPLPPSLNPHPAIFSVVVSDSAGKKGREKREIPEKISRPMASSGTIPTCENPVIRPRIEPGSPCESEGVPRASSLGAFTSVNQPRVAELPEYRGLRTTRSLHGAEYVLSHCRDSARDELDGQATLSIAERLRGTGWPMNPPPLPLLAGRSAPRRAATQWGPTPRRRIVRQSSETPPAGPVFTFLSPAQFHPLHNNILHGRYFAFYVQLRAEERWRPATHVLIFLTYSTLLLDRRTNNVIKPKAVLTLRMAEEYTIHVQVELGQGFSKYPVYHEQPVYQDRALESSKVSSTQDGKLNAFRLATYNFRRQDALVSHGFPAQLPEERDGAARPRSRSEGAIRAKLTPTPRASSLLRARLVTHWTRIREEPGSIPGPDILASAYHGFPKSLQDGSLTKAKADSFPIPAQLAPSLSTSLSTRRQAQLPTDKECPVQDAISSFEYAIETSVTSALDLRDSSAHIWQLATAEKAGRRALAAVKEGGGGGLVTWRALLSAPPPSPDRNTLLFVVQRCAVGRRYLAVTEPTHRTSFAITALARRPGLSAHRKTSEALFMFDTSRTSHIDTSVQQCCNAR